MSASIEYEMTPTMELFHDDHTFHRVVIGPVGSGKSTGCCMEIVSRAQEQESASNKVRYTRWAVIRNTYRELLDTTLATWKAWVPEDVVGSFSQSEMKHHVRFELEEDGTKVDCEVLFRSLDRPDDIRKLLSLDLTGAWVNECRECPKPVIDALDDRVGRFPARKDGGCTWRGIIGDTNPPEEDHWLYNLAEIEKPPNWRIFKQPGGLIERDGKFYPNPLAEIVANLEPDYYMTRVPGKPLSHVRVYYCAQYGFVQDGKPVVPEYVDAVHCIDVDPDPTRPLLIGLDFGLTPAAIFAQQDLLGGWVWIDELVADNMGAVRFGEALKIKLAKDYPDFEIGDIWGDPAGEQRSQTDERTPFQILRAQGIDARPAPSNDFTLRREAIATPLRLLKMDGKPRLVVSPKCKTARKGLAGRYRYRRIQVAGDERYENMPEKNMYSHPVEAGGYVMLGGGEGRAVLGKANGTKHKEFHAVNRHGSAGWMIA